MKDVESINDVSKEEAEELYLLSKEIVTKEKYIEYLSMAYKAIAEGKKIIDLYDTFKKTGTNEDGLPKLAIARADRKKIALTSQGNFISEYFTDTRWGRRRRFRLEFSLPRKTFPNLKKFDRTINGYETKVPMIPVKYYPKDNIKKYFILWEVENWEEIAIPPNDPLLLQRLTKNLFVVIAEWNLSPLEKAILKGL